MEFIKYILIISFFSLFQNCKECNEDSLENIRKLSDKDPFKETMVESDFFIVDPNKDNVIESKSGHILIIPSKGLIDKRGKVVTDSVTIEYSEATNIADFILSNLFITDSQSYYDSYASVFINATKDGEQLEIDPDNPIYFELPANTGINLYNGQRNINGNMSWDTVISPINNLISIPVRLLDFLPPGFELAVNKGLPFKNYNISTTELLDSLFYSFSYKSEVEEEYYGMLCMINILGSKSMRVAQDQPEETIDVDSTSSICGINPASIKAIKHKKYENTLISTREFESRLKSIYATCDNNVLELYIKNLNRNLWEIDQMVADYLGSSHDQYSSFIKFSSFRQTTITLSDKRAKILSNYYLKSKQEIENKITKLKKELLVEKRIERQTVEQKKKEYRDLLQARQKYRMNKFGFELTKFGWYNAASKTSIKQTKSFDLNISVNNGSDYERVYSYVINPKINSIFSLLSTNKIQFDEAFSYDPILLLWENQEFDIIGVGYNGKNMGFKITSTVQKQEVNVEIELDAYEIEEFKRALKKYTRGYAKENQIIVDLEYQAFFYKEKRRREKEEKEFLLMYSLRQLVFPCCTYEWNTDEMTLRDLMELWEN